MLVRVTQKHDVDLRQMKENLKSIIDVIDLMAEYNPGLIQLQIYKQLDIFQDRVTIIKNAIQQLHHHRLAVDLQKLLKMTISITTQKSYPIITKLRLRNLKLYMILCLWCMYHDLKLWVCLKSLDTNPFLYLSHLKPKLII
jgi:hypothetical protein